MGTFSFDKNFYQDRQAEYSEISLNFQKTISANLFQEPALAYA